ncbi:heat-inducible transcription repressor [Parasponia andersonii]|uniref:Heat-inducible transcription repressor n=1 Tax=Parasponia andersonii TaxID=3476 RepID=A0A2P5D2P0_PARAD|nr:heat-inducible transcription repressor [Parasponia andersonii]
MNFLMRSTQTAVPEQAPVRESTAEIHHIPKPTASLEALIAEDPYPRYSLIEDHDGEADGFGGENASTAVLDAKKDSSIVAKHSDVSEEEGWITIPYKELPDNWNDAPDIKSFHTLDRSFVFPGEQVHILACLSACKKDTEIITPFKVAAVMCKNGIGKSPEKENGNLEDGKGGTTLASQDIDQNGEKLSKEKIDPKKDVSTSESLLRLEDHKRQTEMLLQRFEKSHYFVRIAESGEPLWSKKSAQNKSLESFEMDAQKSKSEDLSCLNAVIDKGNFDPTVSGGAARNTVKCCSLSNGDIVVLLQVNVGVDFLKDPVIEILQFEKHHDRNLTPGSQSNVTSADQDPCGELLKWLLPLDNTLPPLARPLSPPISSNSGFGNTSQKSNLASSSGSQLFSFGHFRSYSMSSLPQNITPPPAPVKAVSSKPSFDPEDWDQFSSQKLWKSQKAGSEELLSFRGVSLERERFSVCCGLDGIYMPGRRWMRKLEIIQPVEIHSFAADCNTDDLLCVQIKNVSPAHAPDIVVYIDAITIVFEEASKGGKPLSLPIACIEAGADHSLPNLALRSGEEHSFILKPATSLWKNIKATGERSTQSSQLQAGTTASSLHLPSKTVEGKRNVSTAGQYAIMVSCRCNFTESKLFFKQPTSWRPRISRDLMISVASEMSGQHGPNGGVYQLPVQVLTLQASNLTSEDLTLTVLAPASFTSPPSVVSLNSSPTSPLSPFVSFPEFTGSTNGDKRFSTVQRLSSAPVASGNQKQNGNGGSRSVSFSEQALPISDVIPGSGLGCTHLWLQSRVPLRCVPSHSTATIKLELLPLTDGIITLDTLQIDVKEKGLTYVPEYSLKINATSSISTGIF